MAQRDQNIFPMLQKSTQMCSGTSLRLTHFGRTENILRGGGGGGGGERERERGREREGGERESERNTQTDRGR